jgi:SAM-dependent methyltransferase
MAEAHPSSALIIDLYRRHADDWIALREPGVLFEQPWLDRFRALMPGRPVVLDLGCGSGKPMADYLISQGATVTGVDASGPLLDFARQRHGPPHEWIEADMRGLDLGRTFDGLIAWHSFFHLSPDDQRAMFPAFGRHVRPGGALMFTGGAHHGEHVGEWNGEPLYHGSLSAEEYRERLDAAGFEIVMTALNDPTCGNSNIWLAQKRG